MECFLSTFTCKDPTPLYLLYFSYLYEPEGNACSLTDSTAEEHVLALVEHSADEARDRINRYMPSSKVLYYSCINDHTTSITILPPKPAFYCSWSKQGFVWLLFTLCNLCFQIGHLRKETDGSLLYTVVNQLDADAEGWLSLCILLNIQSYNLLHLFLEHPQHFEKQSVVFEFCRRGDSQSRPEFFVE